VINCMDFVCTKVQKTMNIMHLVATREA